MITYPLDDYKLFEYEDGSKRYEHYVGFQLHHNTQPAAICIRADGVIVEEWYRFGLYHRDNGPAVSYSNGDEVWYQYGKLHREDGPACKRAGNFYYYWYLNGKRQENIKSDDYKIIRKNGREEIHECYNGHKLYYLDGKLHRTDGPAATYADGTIHYVVHGKYHREDGPAVIRSYEKRYFIHGEELTKEEFDVR